MSRAQSQRSCRDQRELYFAIEPLLGNLNSADLLSEENVCRGKARHIHPNGAHGRGHEEIMAQLLVAVSDLYLNLTRRAVLSKSARSAPGRRLKPGDHPGRRARVPPAYTYAKITRQIRQMKRCRIISFRNRRIVDIPSPPKARLSSPVPDYCLDEVSDHAMALLLAAVCKNTLTIRSPSGRWEMPAVVDPSLARNVLGLVGFGASPNCGPKASFWMRVVASTDASPRPSLMARAWKASTSTN